MRWLISAKGKSGLKLFWQCINQKPKGSTHIIHVGCRIRTNVRDCREKWDYCSFLQEKAQDFRCTSFVDEDPTKLWDAESRKIVSRIIITELNIALDALNENKAEYPDDITTSMLKNTDTNTRMLILELFNNRLLSGTNPSAWKLGKVILTLKRSPEQDIENYHPITLVSCLSELLTKS